MTRSDQRQQDNKTGKSTFSFSIENDSAKRRGNDEIESEGIELRLKNIKNGTPRGLGSLLSSSPHLAPRSHPPSTEVQILRSVPQQTSRKRSAGSCCCCLVFLVLPAGVLLLVIFFVVLEGDPENIPQSWNDIYDQDPFAAIPPEESARWSNSGDGLSIEVVNCLDDHWYSYFEKSMLDWDTGYPDSLTLSTSSRAPEFDCTQESGIIKVCNGDYGQTPWKGRTEILSDTVTYIIMSASARMNEFYLSSRNTNEMQYAMCHELGHAFGLQHTDENFLNINLGNCMDYTNRYRNSMTPDESNYKFLFALYGLVPGAASYTAPTTAPVTSTAPPSPTAQSNQDSAPSDNGSGGADGGANTGNRILITNSSSNSDFREKEAGKGEVMETNRRLLTEIPNWLQEAIEAARQYEFEGERHSIELPGGYALHIHQLRA